MYVIPKTDVLIFIRLFGTMLKDIVFHWYCIKLAHYFKDPEPGLNNLDPGHNKQDPDLRS